MLLSPNFTIEEFQRASDATLTTTQKAKARAFAVNILQDVRNRFGPVSVTSFVRRTNDTGVRPHASGDAVDFVVTGATLSEVVNWIALNKRGKFGELINERNHVHVTTYGIGGRNEVLYEQREGVYVPVELSGTYTVPAPRDAASWITDIVDAPAHDGVCWFCVSFWVLVVLLVVWYVSR